MSRIVGFSGILVLMILALAVPVRGGDETAAPAVHAFKHSDLFESKRDFTASCSVAYEYTSENEDVKLQADGSTVLEYSGTFAEETLTLTVTKQESAGELANGGLLGLPLNMPMQISRQDGACSVNMNGMAMPLPENVCQLLFDGCVQYLLPKEGLAVGGSFAVDKEFADRFMDSMPGSYAVTEFAGNGKLVKVETVNGSQLAHLEYALEFQAEQGEGMATIRIAKKAPEDASNLKIVFNLTTGRPVSLDGDAFLALDSLNGQTLKSTGKAAYSARFNEASETPAK